MVLKMNALPYNPFFQNFKTLKFLNDLVFHQVHPRTCTYIKGGMFLLYKKIEINCMILCFPFDYIFLKCTLEI
jgi:hypothetical protein